MASALSDGDVAVGIDLGTTFSCVGVFINDHVKIIPNEQGNRITPSMVSFTEDGYVAGDQAKSRLVLDPENTVCESKRLIGRTFDDDTVAEDMKYWPFEVVDIDNKPMVQVTCRGQRRQCSAEEISGIVLTKMKQIAETFLKQEVKRAVITVPAYFNESQRQATKDAARIAGLEVLRIINEPTAAALAYGLQKNVDEEQHILIVDLGGGTFDVSLLRIDDDTIQVKGTGGDTHLGGADFDNKMVDNSINFFNQKAEVEAHVTTDPTTPQYQRLRRACELAKCQISTHNEETIFVEMFHERINLNYEISRQTFEELIEDRLEKTLAIVRQTLEGENMGPKDIDKVVLIGGSTRIPRLRDQLAEMFGRNKICKSINPDEAVAHGAAVQAAILSGSTSDHLTDVVLLDVTPLSLGISLKGDVMLNIVKRNSLIPCRYHEEVTTVDDKQSKIRVSVYQGERPLGKDNHFLGEFVLKDIPPEPPGVPKIDVTFELDVDGCLTVKATDKKTRNSDSITIEPNKSRCSDKDIQRILEDAKEHLIEDIKEKQRVVARNKLEEMATWLMYILLHHSESLGISPATNQGLLTRAKECDAWIKHNTVEPWEAYTERLDVLQESARCVSSEYRFPGKLPNQQNVRVIGGYGVLCYSDDDESDTEVPEID